MFYSLELIQILVESLENTDSSSCEAIILPAQTRSAFSHLKKKKSPPPYKNKKLVILQSVALKYQVQTEGSERTLYSWCQQNENLTNEKPKIPNYNPTEWKLS